MLHGMWVKYLTQLTISIFIGMHHLRPIIVSHCSVTRLLCKWKLPSGFRISGVFRLPVARDKFLCIRGIIFCYAPEFYCLIPLSEKTERNNHEQD